MNCFLSHFKNQKKRRDESNNAELFYKFILYIILFIRHLFVVKHMSFRMISERLWLFDYVKELRGLRYFVPPSVVISWFRSMLISTMSISNMLILFLDFVSEFVQKTIHEMSPLTPIGSSWPDNWVTTPYKLLKISSCLWSWAWTSVSYWVIVWATSSVISDLFHKSPICWLS